MQWDDKDGHYIIKLGDSLLPRYKILKVIGEGTFGKVTQCWDRTEKKYVAIKIIKSIPKYREAAKVEIEILKDIERCDTHRTRCEHKLAFLCLLQIAPVCFPYCMSMHASLSLLDGV